MEVWPGKPYPLGATWNEKGVNFALFSKHATSVELCLFDDIYEHRIALPEKTNLIWHGFVPGIQPGQRYGFRVHGRYEPQHGLRFNPNKLLLDPYARAIDGTIKWDDSLFGYQIGHPDQDLSFSETDSAPFVPKSVVIDPVYDWQDDTPPGTPWHKTIIYELHVKGFTRLNKLVSPELRGTYAGLGSEPVINYLKTLGITAVELMPIHQFVADRHLVERGLTNYWGYNSIGFFAPDVRYSVGGKAGEGGARPCAGAIGAQVCEFREMVKSLHRAGIEVILDVVYNHTGEGNQLGPTLCFRGIDNSSYYRLSQDEPRYYQDYTGTGNTLNMMTPHSLQIIMDSLRYWIQEMHVDGFRFDLASALARELHDVDRLGAFFDIIHQDPVISRTKLIAEPWDVGEGGYQVGNFPPGWTEWNGKYRDTVRDFWRGENSTLAEFASRLTGSSDLYSDNGRQPTASINFITAHDGFTLVDLVSYNEKHNDANGEDNRDGESHNRSWNSGVEGVTKDPKVRRLRERQKRNFMATLFLSQGVPMLLAGDELGRSQGGNNNAYAQDNEISWIHWDSADKTMQEFTRRLIGLVKAHPVFQRRKWFQHRPLRGEGVTEIAWFAPNGEPMSEHHWHQGHAKSLGVFLNGKGIRMHDPQGQPIFDQSFYLMFNAYHAAIQFVLPAVGNINCWTTVLDTNQPLPEEQGSYSPGQKIKVTGRSMMVLRSDE
jgi:isoamylase